MQKKCTITLHPLGESVEVNAGTPLTDILHEFGVEFPCGGKGTCGRCRVRLLKGELTADKFQKDKLKKLNLGGDWRLACCCVAESDITLEVSEFENIILADNSTFEFVPQTGFGLAIDLGTTTVVVQLVDLSNGQILDSVSFVNPQSKFGSDLISRIESCLDGNHETMKVLIRDRIGEVIKLILYRHKVTVSKVVIVGNTVMHHIFSGIDVRPLSFYPFESENSGVQLFPSSSTGWDLPENTSIKFLPSIGSFVGSDILAGIAATHMADNDEYTILIDLGTNGEIVLGNRKKILCASTAAGPAFEGGKISQGMRASTGAVSSVSYENGMLRCHVIGNVSAKGICGSGLIDIVSILLQNGEIGIFGEFNSGETSYKLTSGVAVSQQDIREFQLAKAAIAAGLDILLKKAGITYNVVSRVYIAGGFGNFLNIENVIKTGLIETTEEKIIKFGNTALLGAKMFLFDDRNIMDKILSVTEHINLEGEAGFQDIFVDKLMLF
ncbi:MAG: DUF4445 domain-containing protein [Bacteroidales bacterium]|jgi:uncharacterized 2Fe-2S/4Fe-4S cluster protein (DUF4445 family)|nr:DUF4445 domain-containing protein [Bacteroidales bacterium]